MVKLCLEPHKWRSRWSQCYWSATPSAKVCPSPCFQPKALEAVGYMPKNPKIQTLNTHSYAETHWLLFLPKYLKVCSDHGGSGTSGSGTPPMSVWHCVVVVTLRPVCSEKLPANQTYRKKYSSKSNSFSLLSSMDLTFQNLGLQNEVPNGAITIF